jgi:hypothetical protein
VMNGLKEPIMRARTLLFLILLAILARDIYNALHNC